MTRISSPSFTSSLSPYKNKTSAWLLLAYILGFVTARLLFGGGCINESPDSSLLMIPDDTKHSFSHASSSSHSFYTMIEYAYTRGQEQNEQQQQTSAMTRHIFNIDFWEGEGGLTTKGGLTSQDRIKLASIYSNASSVLEWGLGESTYLAHHVGVPRYTGIDSDATWVSQTRDKVASHYRFHFADIGQTKRWGYPIETNLSKSVWNYQLSPLVSELYPFDVYLVDGRWRVPCALAGFLHARARGASPQETIVIVHDCKQNPKRDGRTLEMTNILHQVLDLVDHSGWKLCIYQRKSTTTDQDLLSLWKQHRDMVQ